MNFFDIKFFHLMLSILYVFALMTATYNPQLKLARVFYFFVCLMFLISGFLSLEKLGLLSEQSYPMWVIGKMIGLGILFVVPPITMKKFPNIASKLNCVFIFVVLVAIYFGVYKP